MRHSSWAWSLVGSPPVGLASIILLAVLVVACGGDAAVVHRPPGEGQPRPFLMGLSSLPTDTSDAAYRAAFDLDGQNSEVVMIQRVPPWADFLPGASVSDRTQALTRLEKDLARQHDLRVFYAIDPTDPADRGRLADLPDELRGADFSDPRVRAAFIAYAKYIALNYKPAYLALGVEVDMFYTRRGDAAFRNFQSLYFEAYDAVKAVSPSTLVFPTFQYENMLGVLNPAESSQPAWALVNRFETKIDALAVSSYPGLVYTSVDALPADYYAALRGRLSKPIIFAATGWSSTVGVDAENEQTRYLRLLLAASEDLSARLTVWYLGRDPTVSPDAGFEPLASMGLIAADGRQKPAWSAWRAFASRPPPQP